MSTFDDDDYDDDSQDAGGTALQQLRKANKAKDRQLKELTEQLQAMQKSVRERSVKDVLAAKGLATKIADFIPSSATTSEEVEAWIAEYGDVFGAAPAEQNAGSQPANLELDALGRISQTQAGGQSFSGDSDQIAGLIAGAANPEALNRILFGNSTGPNVS